MSHPFSPWRSDASNAPPKSLSIATDSFFFFVAVSPFQIVCLFLVFFSVFLGFDAYISIWIDVSKREEHQICIVVQ